MNTYIQIKSPSVLIQINENDNAIQVKGQTEEGYINRSLMKDDPELEATLTKLVDNMKAHQRDQLVGFCGEEAPALNDFDEQMTQLQSQLNSFLEGI